MLDKKQYEMVLRETGSGARASYPLCSYGTRRLAWVSPETGEVIREPQEKTREFIAGLGFAAGGKSYLSLKQLCREQDAAGTWAKDIYGRQVLCLKELFPCFDSYDYANEYRYYRWFFLCEDNKLTRIQFTDTQRKITVTEDVRDLESMLWRRFGELGYYTEAGK